MMTPEDVATTLSLHVEHVRKLIRHGRIKAQKMGRVWRITAAEVRRIQAEGVSPVSKKSQAALAA